MATADQIRLTITTYAELFGSDRAGWVELFSEDATLEDPVGSEVRMGRDEIGKFWDFAHSLADEVEVSLAEPVCVAVPEAAFHIQILTTVGGDRFMIPAIDAMVFDDEAKITQMRAYWSMEDMRPL